MISPIKNPIGENTDAKMRMVLPIYGILPRSATLTGIINKRSMRKGKDKKDPITVCHLSFINFTASPTEKYISPRNCSIVILDVIALTRKKIDAKIIIPNHIATVVSGFKSGTKKGGIGKNP